MFWIPFSIFMMMIGFVLYTLTNILPILRIAFFDWFALIFIAIPTCLLLYALYDNRLIWFLEKIPRNKLLLLFLRRDGDIVPVLGSRAFPGESFIDVPRLGLIHDLGKGTVYKLGKNTVRFALENVNHTANIKYANFTNWLYKLGFNNIRELQACVTGTFPEKEKEVEERLEDHHFHITPIETLKTAIIETKQDIDFTPTKLDQEKYTKAIETIDAKKPHKEKPPSAGKQFINSLKEKQKVVKAGGKWWNK